MSKIDWAKAEVNYVTKPEASYDWIARLFGVDKTTVVRHAFRESWPDKRKQYTQKRISILEERTLEKRVDTEERHLRILRNLIVVHTREILRLGRKQENGEGISSKEVANLASLTKSVSKAITTERIILGMRSQPIRITDQEAIRDIKEMMGYQQEPIWLKYKLSKDLLESTDIKKIEEHLKLLKQYTNKVEETGDYNEKHPIWDK